MNRISSFPEIKTLTKGEDLAQEIIRLVREDNWAEASIKCLKLVEDERFPKAWMHNEFYAINTKDFKTLLDRFDSQEFLGSNGDFLIVCPYSCPHRGEIYTKFSAILGKRVNIKHQALEGLDDLIRETFSYLAEPIPEVISFYKIDGCGHFEKNTGLPFIPPNGWAALNNSGPVLNDVEAQRARYSFYTKITIPQIFDADTAELILDVLRDETTGILIQQLEYQFHEAGHASGLGLLFKLQNNLLHNYWIGSVEDWRADGVELELIARKSYRNEISEDEAGKVAAAYLGIKLGADAFRLGGSDKDHDVNAAILTLDRLLESGLLKLNSNGQMGLRDPSYRSLFRAFEPHRREALCLTHKELALDDPSGLIHLYSSIRVPQATRVLFNSFLLRCKSLLKAD